jgi:integrase
MSKSHSTRPVHAAKSDRPAKPAKPRDDFPLFPHASGQWAKKIRGRMYYFGSWPDPVAAEERYRAEADDLHAGRTPRTTPDATEATVKHAANAFLRFKQELLDAGELSPISFRDYKSGAAELLASVGKGRLLADLRPADFAALRTRLAAKWGPARLGKTMQTVRSIFKHAFEEGLIDRPQRFGPSFKQPSKKVMRLERAKRGPRVFTADEIRRLLDIAGVSLQAMILLGINAGLGNADCGHLPVSAFDTQNGWLDYPRPKTGIARRAYLWPETIAAIRAVLAKRCQPTNPADAALVFITKYGANWFDDIAAVTKEFTKLMRKLGIKGRRNFYTLRHTFRTVADGAKDQPAADLVMGHEVAHMSSVYREGIGDERLRAVSEYVRNWLFDMPSTGQKEAS